MWRLYFKLRKVLPYIKDIPMSHDENTKLLEVIYEAIDQAVVDNDPDKLYQAYLDLVEGGFDEEAKFIREKFRLISTVS